MRIYIDFDDVLCETARHLSMLARELFNRHVPYEAISGFDLQAAFDLSTEEITTLMKHAHQTAFLVDITPTPGSLDAIRFLETQGHKLIIVTGRPPSSHEGSLNWLRKHELSYLEILYVDKYGRGAENTSKNLPRLWLQDEFAALHFDIAIDDAPSALDLLASRQNCTVIVYDRPWNQHYTRTTNMRRISSWPEIVNLIGTLTDNTLDISTTLKNADAL